MVVVRVFSKVPCTGCAVMLLIAACSAISLALCRFSHAQSTDSVSDALTEVPAHRTYVELYVNSKDPQHVAKVLARVVSIQKQGRLSIPFVYHIGDYSTIKPELKDQLRALKTRVIPLSRVPSDLQVQSSPSWVIVTTSGRHIVEGILGIERCINENGEFVDISKLPPDAAGIPTTTPQRMEGF